MASAIWWIFEEIWPQIWLSYLNTKKALIVECFPKEFGHLNQFWNLNPAQHRGDFTMQFHKNDRGNLTWKLKSNVLVKDINIKGAY